MTMQACVICDEEIDLSVRSGWARRIDGWEEVRRGGGANKIVRRRTHGQVAHVACLDPRIADGKQKALWGTSLL